MSESPFDEATRLDAIVGAFYDVLKEPAIAAHDVAVFVGGVSGADAIGLADDARLLIEAFVRDPSSFHRETPRRGAAAPEPDGDLDIALHGLDLSPEDEGLLAGLIRDLVQQRRAPRRTER